MITVTGAIFGLLNPAQGTAQAQPEQSDLQQRMRIGSDVLFKELLMAGAGPYLGSRTGSLINFFAPIVPRRMGLNDADARDVALADTITLSYIPNSYSQTTIEHSMPPQSTELKVTYPPNCPVAKELCGFEIGMSVIIFDSTGHFDTFTLTQVQDDAGHLQHRGQNLNHEYAAGSTITQIVTQHLLPEPRHQPAGRGTTAAPPSCRWSTTSSISGSSISAIPIRRRSRNRRRAPARTASTTRPATTTPERCRCWPPTRDRSPSCR